MLLPWKKSGSSLPACGHALVLPAKKPKALTDMDAKDSLRISLLGKLAVLRRGARVQLPQSKKTRALLAYLVVTARPHSRARLCAMLWPVPDDPRAALRWSLTRLRPLVDDPAFTRIIADRMRLGSSLIMSR